MVVHTLFALGSNGSGQLGLGHNEDVSTPQPVLPMSPDQDNSVMIKRLAAGGNHTVVLYQNGRAFSSGDNSDGRCGTDGTGPVGKFREVNSPDDSATLAWEDVVATWSATILLRNQGREVWVCGSGGSGELGLGDGVLEAEQLTQVPNFPPNGMRVVQMAACMAHVVAVLANGQVWGWGKGRKGQLGAVAQDVWMPRRVEGVRSNASHAACGKDFTCVSEDNERGDIIMLGPSGRDRFDVKAQAPSGMPCWRSINASWGSVFVLQKTGEIVAWGRDDHGQLPPPGLPPIVKVAAGSEHCLAWTEEGDVFAWGWGEHGNCGQLTDGKYDVKGRWNKLDVPFGREVDIFAGCATSFISTAGASSIRYDKIDVTGPNPYTAQSNMPCN
jgi:protein ATS1